MPTLYLLNVIENRTNQTEMAFIFSISPFGYKDFLFCLKYENKILSRKK